MQQEIQKSMSCREVVTRHLRIFVSDGTVNERKSSGRYPTRSRTPRHSSSRSVSMRDIVVGVQNAPLYPAHQPCGVTNGAGGFTLIELLVVVLIIGILAAVALPQYQKAVEKSRATQAITLLKSAYQAAEAYQLANGSWPASFDEMSIEIPWTGTICGSQTTGVHCLSNSDWSLELWNNANVKGFTIIRLSGTYKGGGFTMRKASGATVPLDKLLCYEYKTGTYAISHAGIYCPKFFKATYLESGDNATIYTFMQ